MQPSRKLFGLVVLTFLLSLRSTEAFRKANPRLRRPLAFWQNLSVFSSFLRKNGKYFRFLLL
jgi:hypothetical protein